MEIVTKLRVIRKRQKMSQETLGEKIGTGKQHISLVERGKGNPGFELIEKMAEALGYKVELLMEDGNYTPILKDKNDEIN